MRAKDRLIKEYLSLQQAFKHQLHHVKHVVHVSHLGYFTLVVFHGPYHWPAAVLLAIGLIALLLKVDLDL